MSNAVEMKVQSYLNRLVDVENPGAGTSVLYRVCQREVGVLVKVSMVLPGSGNPLASDDPETTLADLVGFGTVAGIEEIQAAADAVTQAFNDYFGAEIKSFAQKVGKETITATKPTEIFEVRRAAEVEEHNKLFTEAKAFQANLTQVATKLGIPLSIVPPATPVKAKKKVKKNAFSFLYVPTQDDGAGSADRTETYDWQTPAIFDAEAPDAVMFDRIYEWLMVKNLEAAVVKTSLEQSYGMTTERLQSLFGSLYNLTSQQIDQSQKILAYIEKDYLMYQNCMLAGLELQSVVVDVVNYFGLTIGKPQKKNVK